MLVQGVLLMAIGLSIFLYPKAKPYEFQHRGDMHGAWGGGRVKISEGFWDNNSSTRGIWKWRGWHRSAEDLLRCIYIYIYIYVW